MQTKGGGSPQHGGTAQAFEPIKDLALLTFQVVCWRVDSCALCSPIHGLLIDLEMDVARLIWQCMVVLNIMPAHEHYLKKIIWKGWGPGIEPRS